MKFICLFSLVLFSSLSYSQNPNDPGLQQILNRPESVKCRKAISKMDHIEIYNSSSTYTHYEIVGLIDNQYETVILEVRSQYVTGIGGAGQITSYLCTVRN